MVSIRLCKKYCIHFWVRFKIRYGNLGECFEKRAGQPLPPPTMHLPLPGLHLSLDRRNFERNFFERFSQHESNITTSIEWSSSQTFLEIWELCYKLLQITHLALFGDLHDMSTAIVKKFFNVNYQLHNGYKFSAKLGKKQEKWANSETPQFIRWLVENPGMFGLL